MIMKLDYLSAKNKNFIKLTKELRESLYNPEDNLLVSFREPSHEEGIIILYHETTIEKLKTMLKEGIKLNKALKENGSCIWASDKLEDKNNWMYGNVAVCFEVNEKKAHKANQHEYQVYTDIPVSDFISIYTMSHRTEVGKEKLIQQLELNEELEPLYPALEEKGFKFSYTPAKGASYLMPNGKFLNMQENELLLDPLEETGKATHPDLDYYLYDKGIVGDEDEANRTLIKSDNAIRLNDGTNFENEVATISLPENQLTAEQYEQLQAWLDKVMYLSTTVDVGDEVSDEFITYKFANFKNKDGSLPEDIIKDIRKRYAKLEESLLTEKKRSELISKSKAGAEYAKNNQYRGKNRWERRKYSKISTSVADYNKIDMNAFWKGDILEFGIKVQGETNNYVVTVLFEGILDRLQDEVLHNKNKLEFKCILRALINTFNSEDVYISCSCPDFQYSGINYYSYRQGYNSKPIFGKAMQAPVKNNPGDTKGAGCKHINLILANMTWMMKIASVINNYIWYCKDNMELNYGQYIFPKIYGMDYDKAIQLVIDDYDENGEIRTDLVTDEETINLSNALGRRRTQFKPRGVEGGNPRYERPKVERENPDQIKLDLEEPTDEVGVENEEES